MSRVDKKRPTTSSLSPAETAILMRRDIQIASNKKKKATRPPKQKTVKRARLRKDTLGVVKTIPEYPEAAFVDDEFVDDATTIQVDDEDALQRRLLDDQLDQIHRLRNIPVDSDKSDRESSSMTKSTSSFDSDYSWKKKVAKHFQNKMEKDNANFRLEIGVILFHFTVLQYINETTIFRTIIVLIYN